MSPTNYLTTNERRQLDELLAAHAPLDEVETRHLAAIRDFCARQANPFSRAIVAGHLTGAAFILDPAGRVLLTHHRRLDLWIQLGGHSDGERVAHEVALREAVEESGLTDLRFHPGLRLVNGDPALLDVDVHEIPARPGEPAHEHLDLRFLLLTESPAAIRVNENESKALEWLDVAAARERCEAGMGRAFDRIEEHLRALG